MINIYRILIILAILFLIVVGLFSKGTWDVKIVAVLFGLANIVIFRSLIFNV